MNLFVSPGDDASRLAAELRSIIFNHSANAPRSLQQSLGLSEVGEPCIRKIGYKLMAWEKTNKVTDPWAAISGTAIHAWLADAFGSFPDRFLVEHQVTAAPGFAGTCDLFDIANGVVIDHKCVGATSMKVRKSDGMTSTQRVQVNLYGLGLENAGYTVNKVALAFYPLGGRLDGLHTIVEPYDRELALAAIERIKTTQDIVWQLDPEKNPGAWDVLPKTTSRMCLYCPWFLPNSTDPSVGCSGEEVA